MKTMNVCVFEILFKSYVKKKKKKKIYMRNLYEDHSFFLFEEYRVLV